MVESTVGLLSGDRDVYLWADALDGLVRLGSGTEVGKDVIIEWQDPNPHDAIYVGLMTGWGSQGVVTS